MVQHATIASRGHRYLALDSLRGVCACLVALGHILSPTHLRPPATFLFVDFFFVLSGFVIAASYGDRLAGGFSIKTFMGLRLGRIYPLHLFILLVMLASELALANLPNLGPRTSFDEAHSIGGFVASVFIVQIFYGENVAYWNAVSWSIAAEVWVYLLYAFVFRFAGRWIVPVSLLIALPMPFLVWDAVDGRSMNAFHDGAIFRCIYGFALGVVAFSIDRFLRDRLKRISPFLMTVLEAGLVAGVALFVGLLGSTPWSFFAPPLFVIVVVVFAREEGACSHLLWKAPFVLLGTLSYSIYMVHHYVELRIANVLSLIEKISGGRLNLVEQAGPVQQIGTTPLMGDLLVIAIMIVVVTASYFTYRWVEHPARLLSRKLILGERAKPADLIVEREAPTF